MKTNIQKAKASLNLALREFKCYNIFDAVMRSIKIASQPDIFSTDKKEFPEKTGHYLYQLDINEIVPKICFYSKDLNVFYNSENRVIHDEILWASIPEFK